MEAGKSVKKVKKYGSTLWIPLPSQFVKAHEIAKDDDVEVFFDDMLHVKTIDKEELNKKLEEAKKLFEEETKEVKEPSV